MVIRYILIFASLLVGRAGLAQSVFGPVAQPTSYYRQPSAILAPAESLGALVLEWKFAETNNPVIDTSPAGQDNTGDLGAPLPVWNAPAFTIGPSYQLIASSTVTCDTIHLDVSSATQATIMGWFNHSGGDDAAQKNLMLFISDDGSSTYLILQVDFTSANDRWNVFCREDNTLQWQIQTSANSADPFTSGWYMWTLRFDGGVASFWINYFDFTRFSTTTDQTVWLDDLVGGATAKATNFTLRGYAGTTAAQGLRIYTNKVLTDAEVYDEFWLGATNRGWPEYYFFNQSEWSNTILVTENSFDDQGFISDKSIINSNRFGAGPGQSFTWVTNDFGTPVYFADGDDFGAGFSRSDINPRYFTFSIWWNTTSLTAGQDVHALIGGASTWVGLMVGYYEVNGKVRAWIDRNGEDYVSIDSDVVVQTNVWYHTVVILDSVDDTLKMWINSIPQTDTILCTNITWNAGNIQIGRYLNSGTHYYNGYIGDIDYFNISTNGDWVTNKWNAGKARFGYGL